MRSLGGALALLIVLAVVGLMALRQVQREAPAVAASGALPGGGPADAAAAARQRATDNVTHAFEAASAARDAAERR